LHSTLDSNQKDDLVHDSKLFYLDELITSVKAKNDRTFMFLSTDKNMQKLVTFEQHTEISSDTFALLL